VVGKGGHPSEKKRFFWATHTHNQDETHKGKTTKKRVRLGKGGKTQIEGETVVESYQTTMAD